MRGARWFCALSLISLCLLVPDIAASETLAIDLVGASLERDQQTGQPVIAIVMTPASGRAFAGLTARNVTKPLEFRVDGRAVMKPVIREPVLGGKVQISGVDADEGRAVAERLSSGAAKLEVEVID